MTTFTRILIISWAFLSLFVLTSCQPLHANTRLAAQRFAVEGVAAGPALPPRDLTFGTYNLKGLSDVPHLREDLTALSFVNAWGFQEVQTLSDAPLDEMDQLTPDLLKVFHDILPANGAWHGVYVPLNARGDEWEGQAIVSRWPIVKAEVWPLDATGEKHRAALCAWLDTPAGQVRFVNTDHETALLGIGPDDRAKQVRDLVQRLAKEPSGMGIVAGDFNTSGDVLGCGATREIALLWERMETAGFTPISTGNRDITFHAWPWYWRLDHMFLRDLTCVTWGIYQGRGSDHYPVWCRGVRDARSGL